MKAIICTKYGTPDVLRVEEVAEPVPKDDEILVRVRAATVSTADCEVRSLRFPLWFRLMIRLMFGLRKPRQPIFGQEMAGDVVALGNEVREFEVGDPIFAPLNRFGAHAEYLCLPREGAIAVKPENLTYEEAACLTVFALNALHFIGLAELEGGQRLLINGAGGGMGTIAVQLAKLAGAEVTAVDSAGKLDMLRAIGADRVIDFEKKDFTRDGKTYDVILDVHGRSPFDRCIRSLSRNGRYILANPMLSSICRGILTNRTGGKKVLFRMARYRQEDLERIRQLAEAGKIKPVIDRAFPLDQAAEAHRYVDTGQKKGNVVLNIAAT